MTTIMFIKLTLLPVLIGLVSLAGRRWGPAITGWLVALPLTSGPVVLFLALEQGPAFAARAAQGTLLGIISLALFCLVYSILSRRAAWFPCVAVSWSVFFVLTLALDRITEPALLAFLAAAVTLAVVLWLLPTDLTHIPPKAPPAWEIPMRMAAATAVVVTLTAAAHSLGPRLSGLLTPFPVAATILGGFTHHFEGAAAAVRLFRGLLAGLFGFAAFFLIVALTIESWGLAASFGVAALAIFAMHGASLWLLNRHSRSA
jgi:hypothetical protein